jgi:hypothetical protein
LIRSIAAFARVMNFSSQLKSLAGFGLGEVSLANPDMEKALKHLEFVPCWDNYLKDMSIQ